MFVYGCQELFFGRLEILEGKHRHKVEAYESLPQQVDLVRGSTLDCLEYAVICNIQTIEMKVDLGQPEIRLMQLIIRMRRYQVFEHGLALVGLLI